MSFSFSRLEFRFSVPAPAIMERNTPLDRWARARLDEFGLPRTLQFFTNPPLVRVPGSRPVTAIELTRWVCRFVKIWSHIFQITYLYGAYYGWYRRLFENMRAMMHCLTMTWLDKPTPIPARLRLAFSLAKVLACCLYFWLEAQ